MPLPPEAPTPREPLLAHHQRLAAGEVLGDRFEVLDLIGQGGMAAVYRARDRELRSLVAIKVLCTTDGDNRRRFLDEGRLLANLRHPHLVQVLAVGEAPDGRPYLALEHLRGRDLAKRLAQEGPLPWREAVEGGSQVAGALSVFHRLGVLHRDIKPSNIVQLEGTERLHVKLIDLGVAKVHDWASLQDDSGTPPIRHQTEIGHVVGTAGFRPPDAAFAPQGPRVDVYGLAATIYMLCTGVVPVSGEWRPMRDVRPECDAPQAVDDLLRAGLEILSEDRISFEDFAACLEMIRRAPSGIVSGAPWGELELLELLGVGAKAEVFRAYDRGARRYVALKRLNQASRASEEERARFAREARVLASVRHPALPELYSCLTTPGCSEPFIVMQLMRGRRVCDFFGGSSQLSPTDVLAVARRGASALVALHDRGIVHRDLNNKNILIDLERREIEVAIVDAGSAELTEAFYAQAEERYLTPPERRGRLPSGGLERLDWSAPEVRAGEGWTGRSDVWTLGLQLYKLLTCKLPFAPRSNEYLPARSVVPSCPTGLDQILRRALDPDPTRRLDARAMLQALEELAEELAAEIEAADEEADADEGDELVKGEEGTAPPSLPPAGPAGVARRTWVRRALEAGALAAVVVLAFWAGRATGRSEPAAAATAPTSTSTFAATPASAATPAPPLAPTFDEVMAGLEPKLRSCAPALGATEVKVYASGLVRVSNLPTDHPSAECLARIIREASPPLANAELRRYTFFK